ncbi:MAG: hypothetical protein ACE5K4_09385 [Candidatus Hydrothermarchaeota archaeon]
MKRLSIGLVFVVILLVTVSIPTISEEKTQNPEKKNYTKSFCYGCHDVAHSIHADVWIGCSDCHGFLPSVEIPECVKCHSPPIHEIHERPARENCTTCHGDVTELHVKVGEVICARCHGADVAKIHGGACAICHQSPPEIVKPTVEEDKIICQACHADNLLRIHHEIAKGNELCYKCHGTVHYIHAKKRLEKEGKKGPTCENCHGTIEITIPECTKCHKPDVIHALGKLV